MECNNCKKISGILYSGIVNLPCFLDVQEILGNLGSDANSIIENIEENSPEGAVSEARKLRWTLWRMEEYIGRVGEMLGEVYVAVGDPDMVNRKS